MRMLHEPFRPTLCLESVQHQQELRFKRELIMAVEDMRENREKTGKIVFEDRRLHKIVFDHTGVFTQWHIDVGNMSPNAAVMPSWIDTNNPLINRWHRWEIGSKDGEAALAFAGQGAEGTVDLVKGRVGGIYSKVVNPAWVTEGALYSTDLTPGEVAAMIAHEVGHIVMMFACIGQIDTTCMILANAVRANVGAMPKAERVVFYSKLQEATGVNVSRIPEALNSTSTPTICAVLTSEVTDSFRSEFGSPMYDLRSWEAMSDQFASRMGFGVELATALDKLYRQYDPIAYRSTPVYLLMELVKFITSIFITVGMLISSPILTIVVLSVILSVNPHERTYDRPQERIKRLYQDCIDGMKDKRMTKAKAQSLTADAKVFEKLLKEMKARETFYEKLWTFFSAYTRDQKQAMRELQTLEELINNDMFLAAAELRTLND